MAIALGPPPSLFTVAAKVTVPRVGIETILIIITSEPGSDGHNHVVGAKHRALQNEETAHNTLFLLPVSFVGIHNALTAFNVPEVG